MIKFVQNLEVEWVYVLYSMSRAREPTGASKLPTVIRHVPVVIRKGNVEAKYWDL